MLACDDIEPGGGAVAIVDARVLDTAAGRLSRPSTVVVRDGRIEDIALGTTVTTGLEVIDAHGGVVMPGLVDAHAHPTQASGDFHEMLDWQPSYHAARTQRELEHMLRRGFTTVRDMGGADVGVRRAIDEGLWKGPRLLVGGPIFAPTGGHALTQVCDGEVELRRALREQFRDGADHVKLTLSGGIVSKMRVEALAFSDAEIAAAVDEARLAGRYVAGHAYTAEAVARALRLGVRTIEHGTSLDEECLRLLAAPDRAYVPTLVTYWALLEGHGKHLTDDERVRVAGILDDAMASLKAADDAGVTIGYGTDLHGAGLALQLHELRLRSKVQSVEAVLRDATCSGASIVRLDDLAGVQEGALADLLIIDADPRKDLDAIADPDRPRLVMSRGDVVGPGLVV